MNTSAATVTGHPVLPAKGTRIQVHGINAGTGGLVDETGILRGYDFRCRMIDVRTDDGHLRSYPRGPGGRDTPKPLQPSRTGPAEAAPQRPARRAVPRVRAHSRILGRAAARHRGLGRVDARHFRMGISARIRDARAPAPSSHKGTYRATAAQHRADMPGCYPG